MAASLNSLVSQFETDSNIVRAIVHGPASGSNSIVETAGGPVKTIARVIEETGRPFNASAIAFDRGGLLEVAAMSVDFKLSEPGISIMEFPGADASGTVSSSAAVQKALTEALKRPRAKVIIPAGIFVLNAAVVGTLASLQELVIEGQGNRTSILVVDNSDGGILLNSWSRNASVTLRNLKIAPGRAGAGTGFQFTVPGGGNQSDRMVQLENVTLTPINYLSPYWFNRPIVTTGMYRIMIDNVISNTGFGVTDKQDCILDITDVYSPHIRASYLNGKAIVGIKHVSVADPEGLWISETVVNGSDTGIDVANDGIEPGLFISHCHINSRERNIRVNGVKFGSIDFCLLYSGGGNGIDTPFADIEIIKADGLTLDRNTYRMSSTPLRRHVSLSPTGQSVRGISINEGGYHAKTLLAPIYIGSGCNGIEVNFPANPANYDFASYPADLYEVAEGASSIQIRRGGDKYSKDDGAASGPDDNIWRDSASPAASDALGRKQWKGRDSAGAWQTYASQRVQIGNPAAGAFSGIQQFYSAVNGSLVMQLTVGDGIASGNYAPAGNGSFLAAAGYWTRRQGANVMQLAPNGPVLFDYTAAQIASAAQTVNTAGKYKYMVVWDSTNGRAMVAQGPAATDPWRVIDGSATVIPA